MTNALPVGDSVMSQPMTLEDFLEYEDGTDAWYELEDGALRLMPAESQINVLITSFLFAYLIQAGISFTRLSIDSSRSCEIPELRRPLERGGRLV